MDWDMLFAEDARETVRREPHPALDAERIRRGTPHARPKPRVNPDAVERESLKRIVLRADSREEFERTVGPLRTLAAVGLEGTVTPLARSRRPERLTEFANTLRGNLALVQRVRRVGGPPSLEMMPHGSDDCWTATLTVLALGEDVELTVL